jgi:hypothetical protein
MTYHITFIFTLPNNPRRYFGKIIFNYCLDSFPTNNLDDQIKHEIFDATRKSIDSLGIIGIFKNYFDISEDEKYAFDLYLNVPKDYYYSKDLRDPCVSQE